MVFDNSDGKRWAAVVTHGVTHFDEAEGAFYTEEELETPEMQRLINSGKITSVFVKITREIAERLLSKNRCNRPINRKEVLKIASDINNGDFKIVATEPLMVDSSNLRGNQLSAQHRLSGLIESDADFIILPVRFNATPDDRRFQNTGRAQSVADDIAMFSDVKFTNNNWAGGLIPFLARFEGKNIYDSQNLSRLEKDKVIDRWSSDISTVEPLLCSPQSKLGPISAAFVIALRRMDPALFQKTVRQLDSGEEIPSKSPVLKLRDLRKSTQRQKGQGCTRDRIFIRSLYLLRKVRDNSPIVTLNQVNAESVLDFWRSIPPQRGK